MTIVKVKAMLLSDRGVIVADSRGREHVFEVPTPKVRDEVVALVRLGLAARPFEWDGDTLRRRPKNDAAVPPALRDLFEWDDDVLRWRAKENARAAADYAIGYVPDTGRRAPVARGWLDRVVDWFRR